MVSIDWNKFYYAEQNSLLLTVVGVDIWNVFGQTRYEVWWNRPITTTERNQIWLYRGSGVTLNKGLGSAKYGIPLEHPIVIFKSDVQTASGGLVCGGLLDIFQHTAATYRLYAQLRWNNGAPVALRGIPLSPVFDVPSAPPVFPGGNRCTGQAP